LLFRNGRKFAQTDIVLVLADSVQQGLYIEADLAGNRKNRGLLRLVLGPMVQQQPHDSLLKLRKEIP
jgi:hypothetical protein